MNLKAIISGIFFSFVSCVAMAQTGHMEGTNIISCAPVEIVSNGYGSGLSWERFFDKLDWMSFDLPVIYTVNPDYNNGMGHMFYFNPGIKMYTNMHGYRRAKFSIGPSLFVGAGRGTNDNYFYYYGSEQKRLMYGAMLNLGLNWFPTQHIYLAVDYGQGVTSVNRYGGVELGTSFPARLSLKIGYMFKTNRPAKRTTEEEPPVRE